MKDRKKDHIALAFLARTGKGDNDPRFYYEPMLGVHPRGELPWMGFLGKKMRAPVWVSSMTGGTEMAKTINRNLAMACHEFGMGMGLGSCRPLLEGRDHLEDFDFREVIGDELPFYANLGIAQVEEMVLAGDISPVEEMVDLLRADGLVIHVNPIQEWLQPEGNRFMQPPIDTVRTFLEMTDMRVVVKEVGQGMGKMSLRALLQLPLQAIEFGAFGGTNFARLELMRSDELKQKYLEPVSRIGHDAFDMTNMVNEAVEEGVQVKCREVIISGGITSFLDGFYLINRCELPSIYGQASEFLKYASKSYDELRSFVEFQMEGLKVVKAFCEPRV